MTTMLRVWVVAYGLSCVVLTAHAFVSPTRMHLIPTARKVAGIVSKTGVLKAFSAETGPSDYDSADLQDEKSVAVDDNEEDDRIRDALKRELLLFSSVTNRGEYATKDEQVRSFVPGVGGRGALASPSKYKPLCHALLWSGSLACRRLCLHLYCPSHLPDLTAHLSLSSALYCLEHLDRSGQSARSTESYCQPLFELRRGMGSVLIIDAIL
jgi:hypothetical protein